MPVIEKQRSLADVLGISQDSTFRSFLDFIGGGTEDQISNLVAPLVSRGTIARKVGQVFGPEEKVSVFELLKQIPKRFLKRLEVSRLQPTLDHLFNVGVMSEDDYIRALKSDFLGEIGGVTVANKIMLPSRTKSLGLLAEKEFPPSKVIAHEIGHFIFGSPEAARVGGYAKSKIDPGLNKVVQDIYKSLSDREIEVLQGAGKVSLHNSRELIAEGVNQYVKNKAGRTNYFEKFPEGLRALIISKFEE